MTDARDGGPAGASCRVTTTFGAHVLFAGLGHSKVIVPSTPPAGGADGIGVQEDLQTWWLAQHVLMLRVNTIGFQRKEKTILAILAKNRALRHFAVPLHQHENIQTPVDTTLSSCRIVGLLPHLKINVSLNVVVDN